MNKPTVTEKVVPPGIALMLKQKGFDWKIATFYEYTPKTQVIPNGVWGGYCNHYRSHVAYSNSEWAKNAKEFKQALCKHIDAAHPPISAPTYDMVVDWLLDRGFYIHALIDGKYRQYLGVCDDIFAESVTTETSLNHYFSRYEALNWAILHVLNKLSDVKSK